MFNFKKSLQLIICAVFVTACNSEIKPIPYLNNGQDWDKSIVILGDWDGDPETPDTYLHWAPVNVGYDATGEIASKDDHRLGRLYQWGAGSDDANKLAKMRYYNEPRPKFWYNGSSMEQKYNGGIWKNGCGPNENGWRLPTEKELKALIIGKNGGYGWTTSGNYAGSNSYKGAEFFGMNSDITPGKGVFFPAAGLVHSTYSENPRDFSVLGAYWTAEAEAVNRERPVGDAAKAQSPALIFGEERCDIEPLRHSFAISVRLVHDVVDK